MRASALLEVHARAGARSTDGDPPQVLTYGDVPGEYRAALEGAALWDASDRGQVEVGGAEAAAFLHRLLTCDVRSLEPGAGTRGLLLSSKGKVLFDFDLERDETVLRLSTPPGAAPALLAALDTYLFAEKVTLRDATEEHAPLVLCGPRAAEIVQAATGAAPPAADHAWVRGEVAGHAARVTALPVAGSPGWAVDAGPGGVQAAWSALVERGARPAGLVARDSLRVEAGAARWGADVDEGVYPQEARLERAFSLEKGCYVGQEVVAKIDTYGGLNKRLVGLRVAHDDPVPRGTRLHRLDGGEWRDLGLVTSWAYSFALDAGLVLAYVKRRHQAEGNEFRLGEGPATATVVRLPVRAGALPLTGEFE